MKTIFIILSLAILFFGCKGNSSSDPEPDGIDNASFYVYADIDGVPFKCESARYILADNDEYVDMFQLGAYPGEYQELRFGTQHALKGKTGDYTLYYAEYQKSRYNNYENRSSGPINGKCTITKISDNVVEGTFSFDVYSDSGAGNVKVKVTNGRFRAEY